MPAVGSMRLHDAVDPALDSGRYRIRSRPETGNDDPRSLPTAVQHLEIAGPRFTLGPRDIVSRHPPRDAVGAYGADLAHVVLGRRTLPWERRGLGADAPWLALLLVRSDEATLHTNVSLEDVVGARAERFPDRRRPVTAITMKRGRPLEQLLPRLDELELLAHVREVNVADTALAGRDDDGWLAVVVGNRIAVGGDDPGIQYQACVVSLEERDDLRDGAPVTQSLVVLHSWRFTSTSGGGTFRRFIQDADRALIGEAEGDAERVGELGHVALGGTDRDGNAILAGCRGPLVPRPVAEPRPAEVPGPGGGMLPDRSLELARELGRLLGAADGRFLRAVEEWRRGELLDEERHAVAAAVAAALVAAPGAGLIAERAAARGGPDERSLATLAAEGALQRVLGARLPAADPAGVPAAARAARLRVPAPSATSGVDPDDLASLRRRRRAQFGEAAT